MLAFTFAIAAASGILSGLAPVLHTLRGDTISALRDEGGAVATGIRAARWRRGFVVFQVAMSLMLLVGAGLFLRTLRNANAIDLGYQIDSTMVADINLDVRGYSQEAGLAVYRQILDRLRSAPGVAAAGAARVTVLSGGARTVSVSLDGQRIRADGANNLDVRVNVVSDGYLRTLGIPILRGRDFTRRRWSGVGARGDRQPGAGDATVAGPGPDRQADRRRPDPRRGGGRRARHRVSQRARARTAAVLLRAAGAELRSPAWDCTSGATAAIRLRCCRRFARRCTTSIRGSRSHGRSVCATSSISRFPVSG